MTTQEQAPTAASGAPRPARWFGRRPKHRRLPIVSIFILATFIFCGVFGVLLAPHDPNRVDLSNALLPPAFSEGGNASFPLGTDQLGRDELSRLLVGAQVSLFVALGAVILAGAFGLFIALISGFVGGRFDSISTRVTDASMAFPVLLLAIVIVAVWGQSIVIVIIVLALGAWPQYARVLRSEVLRIRTQDYIVMSRVMGGSTRWIIVRHVLPNVIPTLLVLATLQMGVAIIAEGALSFLGIGVPLPTASWGNMLAEGKGYLSTAWWLPVLPGLALSLTVLATNLFGDWLREALDPSTRT